MKPFYKYLIVNLFLSIFAHASFAQIQSPEQFLGYKLGERFTYHYRVVDYFKHLAQNSSQIRLQTYGETYEKRPLMIAILTAESNMGKLEEIRTNNLKITGLQSGTPNAGKPIVWLSYNVHGNESVSMEAVMQTAYELLTNPTAKKWLEEGVIILDPCINPDGRDRYANWYNQMVGKNPNVLDEAREHREPWPGGRYNHYLYDLNRDWAWQSQQETRQRIALYHQWMPHVHVDFHEMGVDNPYYFAPAAEPYHLELTPHQREFQVTIGKNNAKYFDKNGWLYFTKETFDLLYPSYGDSYPMFNGAIGMTYEQGGSGRAGLGILTETGDTLTLAKRISHHHIAGLATIEAAIDGKEKLLSEFKNYFDKANSNPQGAYKSFVIKAENNSEKVQELLDYLDKNQIRYGYPSAAVKGQKGFDYEKNNANASFDVSDKDIVVNIKQPKSVLVKVLFNPKTVVADSLTYDVTAWALPYCFGLKSYAMANLLEISNKNIEKTKIQNTLPAEASYAYIAEWKSFKNAQFLAQVLKQNIRVRYAEKAFKIDGQNYSAGTLLIMRGENEALGKNFDQTMTQIGNNFGQKLKAVSTGFVESGADFGSDKAKFIKPKKVALLSGNGVSATSFGGIWHYLDQQLDYPVTVLQDLDTDLEKYDVLILPETYYGANATKILSYVRSGGKAIAISRAMSMFESEEEIGLKDLAAPDKKETPDAERLKKYAERERRELADETAGSIYKVEMDTSHPLAFGYEETYFTLHLSSKAYQYLDKAWNVGTIRENALIDGFVGHRLKQKLKNVVLFGVKRIGRGSVVFLADDPVFRSSWHNGKLLLSNAIFLVD